MTYQNILTNIKRGEIHPLYLFVGDVDFLKKETAVQIVEQLVPVSMRSFNYDKVYGKEINAYALKDIASQLPVKTPWRVIVVYDGNDLKEKDAFLDYLEDPTPSTCLIFMTTKIDGRKKFYKLFQKNGCLVEFKSLYDNQIPAWIKHRAKQKYQKTITPMGGELLQSFVGNSLGDLDGELEKLTIHVQNRSQITEQDVRQVVGQSRTYSVFDLTDAIGERNTAKALSILVRMLAVDENPVYIVSMLVRHFFMIWKARTAKNKNEAAKVLGKSSFIAEKYLKQAKNFNPLQLASLFELLYAADLQLKSTSTNPKVILEFLIYEICTI